jgi:CubicO group peptidase (beta-lactamase class C family)
MTGTELETYFEDLSGSGRFSGSALFRVGEQILLDAGYGIANRSTGRTVQRQTAFQIASVSKQFTAAAVLMLEEEGKLSVQDLVSKWIPDTPPVWRDITLHHLLTHTSGLVHWKDIPQLDLYHPVHWEAILSAFASQPLKFPPGKGWAYSSPGYHLLARIVERGSGERYSEFLRRNIFERLGMAGTSVGNRSRDAGEVALGYHSEELVPSFDLDTTGMGAGDVWSTTGDLLKWDEALSHPGKILSESSLGRAFHAWAQMPKDGTALEDIAYGYGWVLGQIAGAPVRYHAGDNPGYLAINLWIPSSQTILCLLSNQDTTDLLEVILRVLGVRDSFSGPEKPSKKN